MKYKINLHLSSESNKIEEEYSKQKSSVKIVCTYTQMLTEAIHSFPSLPDLK